MSEAPAIPVDPVFEPFPGTDAETFIQWKGTKVCMDFHCPCGHHSHFDAMFAYNVRCAGCGAVFQLGTQVKAIRGERPGHEPVEDQSPPEMQEDDGCECPGCTKRWAASR